MNPIEKALADADRISSANATLVRISRGDDDSTLDAQECLNYGSDCGGSVEYRMPLSGTGRSFPRCDRHWSERLDQEEITRSRYGHPDSAVPPAGFDPTYAGESWEDD